MKIIIFFLPLFYSILVSQVEYYHPVDTLLNKQSLSLTQTAALKTIKKWQEHSYDNPSLNCQFYPSCSNFCAIQVYNKGAIKGTIMGVDRFLRCNKFASKKYELYVDGYIIPEDRRLSDNLIIHSSKTNKNRYIGAMLSIFPGMGKVYYGYYDEALHSLKYIAPFLGFSYYSHINEYNLSFSISSAIAAALWVSDIYGVYFISNQYHNNKKVQK